jgi:beta-N-acetylhexosaminidase
MNNLSPFYLIRGLLGLALVSLCCVSATSHRAANQPPPTPDSVTPLSRSAQQWVESTIAGLSLEEKAAQMVMVAVRGQYRNPQSEEFRNIARTVGDRGVGGVVMSTSELETLPRLLNDLQASSSLPLLVAADLERGMAFRVRRGTVSLPSAMAVGATRSPEAARFTGEVTAREGRALGIHWAFAPVADVNNNPANPVINVRSYGEDPHLVASMVEAFVEGAHRGGMLTTAKHFPGHGDTSTDSHETRPVVTADRERLAAVELVPFRRAIDAGVDAVMLAHVSVPSLDPSNAPATLSPEIGVDLLRRELGFQGLIVTDALDMAGVRPAWDGEAVIRAVRAGADVMLMPRDPRVAVQSLVRGVEEGQITESRIDISVRRILEAKAGLGLHQQRTGASRCPRTSSERSAWRRRRSPWPATRGMCCRSRPRSPSACSTCWCRVVAGDREPTLLCGTRCETGTSRRRSISSDPRCRPRLPTRSWRRPRSTPTSWYRLSCAYHRTAPETCPPARSI